MLLAVTVFSFQHLLNLRLLPIYKINQVHEARGTQVSSGPDRLDINDLNFLSFWGESLILAIDSAEEHN